VILHLLKKVNKFLDLTLSDLVPIFFYILNNQIRERIEMLNYNYGCVYCKSNKDRKLKYKQLKRELECKPELHIWYENNAILYQYQSTRKEQVFI
jgi:hypothetical protein